MLTTGVLNRDWLPSNALRRYPLDRTATARDASDTFSLPDSLIVALRLPVPSVPFTQIGGDPTRFFLWKVGNYGNGLSLTFGYSQMDGATETIHEVGTALASLPTHKSFDSYPVVGGPMFAGLRGQVTLGALIDLNEQPGGVFEFDLAGGLLDSDAVWPMLTGVGRLFIVDASGSKIGPLTGDVTLRAGNNTQLVYTDGALLFSALSCEDMTADDCACRDTAGKGPPIRTINGVQPDENGNIDLVGFECLEINGAETGRVTLTDSCSTPCAGCPELEDVRQAADALANKLQTLESFSQRLDGVVSQTRDVILGSRLGDRVCE